MRRRRIGLVLDDIEATVRDIEGERPPAVPDDALQDFSAVKRRIQAASYDLNLGLIHECPTLTCDGLKRLAAQCIIELRKLEAGP